MRFWLMFLPGTSTKQARCDVRQTFSQLDYQNGSIGEKYSFIVFNFLFSGFHYILPDVLWLDVPAWTLDTATHEIKKSFILVCSPE